MRLSSAYKLATCLLAFVSVTRSAPASATTATSTAPADDGGRLAEVRLADTRGGSARYWLRTPPGYGPGDRAPLIIALHGTDDTAREAVDFWGAVYARALGGSAASSPAILVAPQAAGRGWADTDLPTIRAMLDDVPRRVTFDSHRVLLAGFSAGGAMAFHLLYVEQAPATAAAALANYLPPSITQEQIRARRNIPVFYAVGRDDINHERMRSGIDRLRVAGADVELYRPHIGHVLDPQVAAAAVEFFRERCRRQTVDRIRAAAELDDCGAAAGMLEEITTQARWHEPAQVAAANDALGRVEASGRRDLQSARAMIDDGRKIEAAALLASVQERYGPSRLGLEASQLRRQLQADPAVVRAASEQFARTRAAAAETLLAAAFRELAADRPAAAEDSCRHILNMYAETPAAERARSLLTRLQTRPAP